MGWVFWFWHWGVAYGCSGECYLCIGRGIDIRLAGDQATARLRLVPTIISTVMRAMVIASVTLSVFEPMAILISAPPAFYYAYNKAPSWAIETLSPPSKREYRKMIRKEAVSKKTENA